MALTVMSVALLSTSGASAQWTGHELALDGPHRVRAGRSARYRGVAYRVRGLNELVPLEGRVRARFASREEPTGPWVQVRSDADGRFEVDVPIPTREDQGPAPRLQVEVGPESQARLFEATLVVRSAVDLVLHTDRRLYEAGEQVHVWAWLRERTSGRPIAGQSIEFTTLGGALSPTTQRVVTAASGVAHLVLEVPEGAPEAQQVVWARVVGQTRVAAEFEVGTRTYERLIARVEVEPSPVAPNAPATVIVSVSTVGGAPVIGALVGVQIDDVHAVGRTGPDGVARVRTHAPAYLVHDTGSVEVVATITHPGHGSVRALGTMRLAVPLSLTIEVVPRHGVLIPEIDDVVYVRLRNGIGEPPSAPTEVTVEGPAVLSGRATAMTDANGIAEIPVRLPIGASSRHRGRPVTSVLVHVAGPLARVARVRLPVDRNAEVAPTPSRPVVEPGDRIEVRIDRRPSAERRDVVLELLDDQGEILVTRWLTPGQRSTTLDVPADRLGLLTLRARGIHSGETLEGVGARARIIVRPPSPDFVTLDAVRERWTVGETARVLLHTGTGGPARFATVLVRDLAAHGGEAAFAHHFLARRFDEALLTPSDATAERLVFAALGADVGADAVPVEAPPLVDALGLPPEVPLRLPRGLRDPFPLARELERRGVGEAMTALEARLARALGVGGLDAITVTTGGARRFRDDLLADDDAMITLGGHPLTPAILEAADPSFRYDTVASRVARERLVRLMVVLAAYLDPGDDASPAARMAAREPFERWLPRMVELGLVTTHDLDDPWGHRFVLRRTRQPAIVVSEHGANIELVSPGPDGRLGTRDDTRDPFARAVDQGTPYALASGEDALMRQLAVLSPVRRTLAAIRESYGRVNAEVREEQIGDAVSAEVSEGTVGVGGLGLVGHGAGGGGSGSGYGHGAGTIRGRRVRSPRIRAGMAAVSGLARVIRERFPPTLLFRPSLVVDPSGTTVIDIPLADSVTTYIVEVIVWRADGWVWSADTRIRVDRDIVISAPVPELAHRGDRISLPLRVANRGETALEVELRLAGSEALGIDDAPAQRVTVPAGDAVVVRVPLNPTRVGVGTIEVAVVSMSGEALDAVRMPIRVVEPARRVALTRDAIVAGHAELELTVPEGADPRDGNITLTVGPALFDARGDDGMWGVWAPPAIPNPDGPRWMLRDARSPLSHAFAIGAAWNDDEVEDEEIDRSFTVLARRLDQISPRQLGPEFTNSAEDDDSAEVRRLVIWAWALLALHQVADAPERRSLPRAFELIERARREVGSAALAQSDPRIWVLAAAALGWTSPPGDLGRTRELVRRVSRHVAPVGRDLWLALEHRSLRGTALLAMAELSIGHRERAFSILATLSRWESHGHTLPAPTRAIARATVHRLMRGEVPTRAMLTIDGVRREVELIGGAGAVDAPELAEPGVHRIEVSAGAGAPLVVEATARFGVPWSRPPLERGPLELSLEGEVGNLDRISELELVVRNRSPRTLRRPIVEIELPTGAELTAYDRSRMGVAVSRGGGVLTLTLPAMRPGNTRRVPLPIRWSVAGHLRGLGVAGRSDDRPAAITVLPPRGWVIEEASE